MRKPSKLFDITQDIQATLKPQSHPSLRAPASSLPVSPASKSFSPEFWKHRRHENNIRLEVQLCNHPLKSLLFMEETRANSVLDVQYRKPVVKNGDKLGLITTLRLVPAYFTMSAYTTQCLICMHVYEEIYGQLTLNKYRENSAEYMCHGQKSLYWGWSYHL